MKKCIEFNGVSKKYEVGEKAFYALDDVSFSIDQHEMVVILGPSGAGKSTLLNIMGGMDHVTDGKVYMDGLDISNYSEKELTDYRAKNIGFIFQFYNILPTLTVKENVDLIRKFVLLSKAISSSTSMSIAPPSLFPFPGSFCGVRKMGMFRMITM